MSYITGNQGRPIQGVSQQPDKTRLPGQCTASVNFRPDVVRGLTSRQGTEFVAKLPLAVPDMKTKWHYYDRGTGEQYIICIEESGKLSVYDMKGQPQNVTAEHNAEWVYLADSNPRDNLKMLTVGDYTFIVNKTKKVLKSEIKTPPLQNLAILYVQFIEYAQVIRLYINNEFAAAYCSYDGAAADQKFSVRPNFVTEKLVSVLTGGAGEGNPSEVYAGRRYGYYASRNFGVDYNFHYLDNSFLFARKDGADFTSRCDDGVNNKNSVVIKDKIDNTTLLPGNAPNGFMIEIDPPGANRVANSSYWLRANTTNADHIVWEETIQPGISVGMDKSTMPHVLIRESVVDGVANFVVRQGEWADRVVGNEQTNPIPTLVDEAAPISIQNIGLFQNRLFMTAGESIVMTRSTDFFNFFRETSQASLDTDPIDIFSDDNKVNFLDASVSFDGDLVFFSKNGQFILSGAEPITAKNATLRKATSFESQLSVDPVASGDSIFFCFKYGRFTGVREFFTDSVTDTKRAKPVTDHVKEYLKGNPQIMKTSTNLNLLLIKTDGSNDTLYTYDWLWQGSEKAQSAWSELKFPNSSIVHFEFVDELIWIILAREDGALHLEKINMGDPDDQGLSFPVRTDRKIVANFFRQASAGLFYTPDPFPLVDINKIKAIRSTDSYPQDMGTPIDIFRDGTNLKTYEDLSQTTISTILGVEYECSYTPTNPVAKDQNDQVLDLDRLVVGSFFINYNTTGDIIIEVEGDSGNVRIKEFNNRILGSPENVIGFAPLVDGQHRVAIRQKSDRYTLTLKTNSHLPLEIRDFGYNGNLTRRGKRI